MKYKYFPHTSKDIKEMLERIGVKSIDDLFSDIPDSLKGCDFALPPALSEVELRNYIGNLSDANNPLIPFRGAGSYDVYVPSVIKPLLQREEFLTSYTPYQPEISQGTLEYIFEYQSYICELTGMDVSNASMYDGATAAFEAIMMACNHTRRKIVLTTLDINPRYMDVISTYSHFHGIKLEPLFPERTDDFNVSEDMLDWRLKKDDASDIACVVLQYPNYYGYLNDFNFVKKLKEKKILLVVIGDPASYALIKSPGELGADIACGEAQTLGVPMAFGGPYIGYIACKSELMRKLPGRIVGATTDVEGRRGFVLTLQAREQHIRREKATSNICSNESLMALNVAIYCSVLGKSGLKEVAKRRYDAAHFLKEALLSTGVFTDPYPNSEFYMEFVLEYTGKHTAKALNKYLEKYGYLGGLEIGNHLLFCATENRLSEEIIDLCELIKEYNTEDEGDLY
ncbi:MAG: aminomethyl-transferring glycine dehydrogenase subunit GcvPA [Bacilli bacterium]|nr:aminomethyl-transferring glycine dehydrogenase subunit GcvPA [Bacilli bacterium]